MQKNSRADYHTISAGASYTHSTTPGNAQANGIKPEISLPQNVEKNAITHTAINANTQITITDQAHQKQDTTRISHDTEHASYTMTQINTEVLDIRKQNSQQIAKEGFKAVGDYAMEQAAKGDKEWEDGGGKKILAHAIVGATSAAVGNGDALGGALGAGAAEAARPATKGQNDATQQLTSTLIGAATGGGTGATTALQGEKYNRQLHQMEIRWIQKHSIEFAKELYGANPTKEQIADAQSKLTEQALRQVDKGWSLKLGDKDNKDAKSFLKRNNAHLFEVKSDAEYYNPTITRYGDTVTKIKDLNQRDKTALKEFYHSNVKNASNTPLKELYIQDLKKRGIKNAKEIWEGAKNSPEALKATYEYIKKTPAKQIGKDALSTGKSILKGVKDTVTEGMEASTASGEIARNTDGTADLLNDLYSDNTAASTGRLMVDEDLLEAVTLVGGATKGALKGGKKLGGKGKGKPEIPMIGSTLPNKQLNANVKETMGYILDDNKKPLRSLGYREDSGYNKWGLEFKNEHGDLPKTDANGKPIEYKEYRVRPLQKGKEHNVHRIVVGSDGSYYYTNTHYGQSIKRDGSGVPFYKAGKLPKEKIKKIFGDSK